MRPLLKVLIPYLLIGLGILAVWFIATECLTSPFPGAQEPHPTILPATQWSAPPYEAYHIPREPQGDNRGAFARIHHEAMVLVET
jgi:hypothetical protein